MANRKHAVLPLKNNDTINVMSGGAIDSRFLRKNLPAVSINSYADWTAYLSTLGVGPIVEVRPIHIASTSVFTGPSAPTLVSNGLLMVSRTSGSIQVKIDNESTLYVTGNASNNAIAQDIAWSMIPKNAVVSQDLSVKNEMSFTNYADFLAAMSAGTIPSGTSVSVLSNDPNDVSVIENIAQFPEIEPTATNMTFAQFSVTMSTNNTVSTNALRDVKPRLGDMFLVHPTGSGAAFTYGIFKVSAINTTSHTLTLAPLVNLGATPTWSSNTVLVGQGLGTAPIEKPIMMGNNGNNTAGWIPYVKTDNVMEIGRFVDFHGTVNTDTDYTVRLDAGSATAVGAGVLTIVSNGTQAGTILTSGNTYWS